MNKKEILDLLRELGVTNVHVENGVVKIDLLNPYVNQKAWEKLERVLEYGREEERDSPNPGK